MELQEWENSIEGFFKKKKKKKKTYIRKTKQIPFNFLIPLIFFKTYSGIKSKVSKFPSIFFLLK